MNSIWKLKIKNFVLKYVTHNSWYWIILGVWNGVMFFEFLKLKNYAMVVFCLWCFAISSIGLIFYGLKKPNNNKKDEVK